MKKTTSVTKRSPYGSTKYKSIDEYHSAHNHSTQKVLAVMRNAIKQAAPKATEIISYNMPAFKLNGMLVYYAAYKNHIGFYPTSSPIKFFSSDLANYKTSKGAIQFAIDKPLPVTLIKKIVKFRIAENNARVLTKKK